MAFKILIFGLPGSGKTTLAESLSRQLDCTHYNADIIREKYDDWDFSMEGRLRQANRMKDLAEKEDLVVCDFVAPTKMIRGLFAADLTIWMNTIEEGRFEDTNIIFEKPDLRDVGIMINDFEYDVEKISTILLDKTFPE